MLKILILEESVLCKMTSTISKAIFLGNLNSKLNSIIVNIEHKLKMEEIQVSDAVIVDFANKFISGGTLNNGLV